MSEFFSKNNFVKHKCYIDWIDVAIYKNVVLLVLQSMLIKYSNLFTLKS